MYSVYSSLGARPGLYKDEYERRYKQTADAADEEDAGDGHREVLEHTEHHAENRAHKRDAQRGKETLAAVGRAHLGGGNVHGHEGRDAVVEEGVAYAADSHEHIKDNYNVTQHLGTKCHAIEEDKVIAADKIGFRFDIPCDNVVICTGDPADNELYKSLVGMVTEVYNIGDSDTPSNLAKNHAAAYALARSI